jgi:hypothetical protein
MFAIECLVRTNIRVYLSSTRNGKARGYCCEDDFVRVT